MFGNKHDKQTRLQKLATLVEQAASTKGVTQAELARQLRVPRSTVKKDLPHLEDAGVLLAEDERGRLTLFGRRTRNGKK